MTMHITDKLAISRRKGYLSLIDEGYFFRIYNQSAYIANELYQQNLTLSCNIIGKLQNNRIVYCGFPKTSLSSRFKDLHKTAWGYEITGNFNLNNYDDWFNQLFIQPSKQVKHLHKSRVKHEINRTVAIDNSNLISQQISVEIKQNSTKNIYLNQRQIAFLINWQRGNYSHVTNENFIESLKRQLLKDQLFI